MIQFTRNTCACPVKNVTLPKKRKKTKSRNDLNWEDLLRCVASIEVNLEDFLQRITQIPHIRSLIKWKILLQYSSEILEKGSPIQYVRKIFRKTNIFDPLIRMCTCTSVGQKC